MSLPREGDQFKTRGVRILMKDTPVTVLLLEEQRAVREFLEAFVRELPGFAVVATCGTRFEAENLCAELRPHVAIIDWLAVDHDSNCTIASVIKERSPDTRVLLFAATTEPEFVQDAVNAGVAGFVDRGSDLETLARAIVAVAEQRQFFSSRVSGVLRELLRRRVAPQPDETLTPREREVLREIARGRYSKEIAAMLGLSIFTVENIRRRIMRKTGLRSVAELTLHAVRLGLAPRPSSPSGIDTSLLRVAPVGAGVGR